MAYSQTIGRVHLRVNDNGSHMHDYRHGGKLAILRGSGAYNPDEPNEAEHSDLSIEEMRNLRYLLDRAIADAEEEKRRWDIR